MKQIRTWTLEDWGTTLLTIAIVLGVVPLTVRFVSVYRGNDHAAVMSHGGHNDHLAVAVDDPEVFCPATGALIDAESDVGAVAATTSGALTPAMVGRLSGAVVPRLTELRAASPDQLHGVLDRALGAYALAAQVGIGDQSARATLQATLAAPLAPAEVDRFVHTVRATCGADDTILVVLRRALLAAPTGCTEAPTAGSEIPGMNRLLDAADVAAVAAFRTACPAGQSEVPEYAPAVQGPCGGALEPVALTDAISVRHGSGPDAVTELLARTAPGGAGRFVSQLAADLRPGCTPPAAEGGQLTNMTPLKLAGVALPHAAFTAVGSAATDYPGLANGVRTGQAFVAVAHGDEVLVLVIAAPTMPDAASLSQLTAAAVAAAGW